MRDFVPRCVYSAALALAVFMVVEPQAAGAQRPTGATARTNAAVARWDTDSTPGCVVGVARAGELVFTHAYGMADLERNVPLSTSSILEAGSVSKQFTAAAVVLLAEDGRLSLDDDIRKYLPEVPEYGTPITIRHLLNHTSGLRDWGSVGSIAGQGRSVRAYTNDHALEIVARQRALNYTPGQEYSYTNSGYNLLPIIVARVSGESFASFTERRIFRPLGMHDTQWRDDPGRLVARRAMAYGGSAERGWQVAQPHEFVHGNGGLLTTVADLVRWDQARSTGEVGGPDFRATMEERGVLNDGSRIAYAAGLRVDSLAGVAEVSHTGSTGGYRAFLGRYPDHGLAVAMLCNAGNVEPGRVGTDIARAFLELPDAPAAAASGPPPQRTDSIVRQPVAEFLGEYHSPDADVTLTLVEKDGRLIAHRPPADEIVLVPLDRDRFQSRMGRIELVRDASGAVTQLSVQASRVYDLRFDRVK